MKCNTDKNIARHAAHTIVSWSKTKQWLMIHISDSIIITSVYPMSCQNRLDAGSTQIVLARRQNVSCGYNLPCYLDSYGVLKFYIDQFVSTYDYIRPLTRLRDLISTAPEMCCNYTIQFSIEMHCMCQYGRTNEYLPVCIFMFIYLIVILCMLNNIKIHNVINNNLWNRYDVGSAPIVLAHHRTVFRAYLCHAIVSRMTSFASCINQCMFTNDQVMGTHVNAIKIAMSRYCPN